MEQIVRSICRHLFQGICVALIVATLGFVAVNLTRGDTALDVAIARYSEDLTDAAVVEQIRREEGLDRPLAMQYFQWVARVITFDLGRSLVSREQVTGLLAHHFYYTFLLAATATTVSILIALPWGILCGVYPGGIVDTVSSMICSALVSVPQFVIGLLLILSLSIKLHWLPVAGFFSPAHLVIPAITLGIGLAAVSSRVIATSLADVRGALFYRFGAMKGLSPFKVLTAHGMRNAAIPVITYIGVQAAHLLDGVVVVETLFAWPGIGKLLLDSVLARDIPVIQGACLLIGLLYVTVNITVDMICFALDPCRRNYQTTS